MPELDRTTLISFFEQAFQKRSVSLLALAEPYNTEALIRAFTAQRNEILSLLSDLDDTQVNYSPDEATFSLSEIISHVVTAQGSTFNALLELSHLVMPHIDHVPQGAGAGARKSLTVDQCRNLLTEATEELADLLRQIARIDNPQPQLYPNFGMMSFKSWAIFQLLHDLDHLNQAATLRQNANFTHTSVAPEQQ
jgi:hypothetical protein